MKPVPASAISIILLVSASATRAGPAEQNPESVVITAGALLGTAIDPDKVPVNIQTLTDADLNRFGTASALETLANQIAGASFANAQGNPYQPNLFYRGFEASPLAGDAQGLAVYANGVRLNQPFGDTLNWDLIPDIAIDRLSLEGSNPVFGLNALGGSLAIQMKNGFTYRGAEAEAVMGSFGRWQSSFQYGVAEGNQALYVAINGLTEHGWREHSPSRLGQLFADFGWRGEASELHLNLTGAATDLTGNGTSPVELLAAKRSAVFTHPDETKNTYGLANLYGTRRISDRLSFQGNLYLSRLHQRTRNGDASEAAPCATLPGFLCFEDDSLVTGASFDPINDFLAGETYAQLNTTATDTTGYGGALQAVHDAALMGHANKLLAGVAIDSGHTDFAAQSELGALGRDRGFVGPGIEIHEADQSIAPVSVTSDNAYYGFYAADIFAVTEALSLNASARYNIAKIDLDDRLGAALSGSHHYSRLNPAAGATYEFAAALSAYAGYSEANRAPAPAEFSCADPAAPCSLTNFFVGDPALKQVVARTREAGLRGQAPFAEGSIEWHAGIFQTDTRDEIQFVASPVVGRAFFANVGDTRRQGFESSLDLQSGPWLLSLDYSYTDATFRSPLILNSPQNPLADSNGQIQVRKGDHLPSIPANLLKATVNYRPAPAWSISLALRAASGVYLQGDEANLNERTGAYAVFDISSSYRLTERLEFFATITNLFDAKYSSFGTFSPTSDVPIAEAPGASDPRSLSPAPPRAAFGGIRVWL
jgi:outer membrane receptor protein involved in Fe transport